MKYTLTIKDNETGKVEQEAQINAIIAGVSEGDEEFSQIIVTNCKGYELLGTIKAAHNAVNTTVKNNPALMLAMLAMLAGVGNDEEEGGEENE